MADPIYEVKVKEEGAIETPQVDPKIVEETANKIAQEKVEGLKSQLIDSISGKTESRFGANGPKSWDEIVDTAKAEAVTTAVDEAEKRFEAKLEADRKAQEENKQTEAEKSEAQRKEEMTRLTAEWQELVSDAVLPDIAPEIRAKLKEGKTYAELTPEEQNDSGLKAYNEVLATHMKLKSEGKSTSLYRTAQKFYNQTPAGAAAPVFGASPPSVTTTDDYSYDDVAANRKAKFGY